MIARLHATVPAALLRLSRQNRSSVSGLCYGHRDISLAKRQACGFAITSRTEAPLRLGERAAQALQHLRDLAPDQRLTLLTASKDADISEAAVLSAILNR